MVVKSVKKPFDIVTCRTDEAAKLQETAEEFSAEALLHALDTMQSALETLKRSASGRVGMEICLLRLCNPELDTSNTALLRRIKTLEDKISFRRLCDCSRHAGIDRRNAVSRIRKRQMKANTLADQNHRELRSADAAASG